MVRRHARLFRELLLVRGAIRNWLSVSVLAYLYKFLPLPERDITIATRAGSKLRVRLKRNAGALYPVLDVFAAEAYACNWEIESSPVVLDIGAHVGAFLVWFAQQHPGITGVAYEPDPAAAEYLKSNLKSNGLSRIETHLEAVSDRAGEANLFRSDPGSGASSLHAHPHLNAGGSIRVAVKTFEDVVEGFAGDISLVKLDCEGAEYEIVLGSAPASWQRVRRVVVEYHPVEGSDPSALVERLEGMGFGLVKRWARSSSDGTRWFAR